MLVTAHPAPANPRPSLSHGGGAGERSELVACEVALP
jgi:hypothetical protein